MEIQSIRNAEKCYRCALCFGPTWCIIIIRVCDDCFQLNKYYRTESMEFVLSAILLKKREPKIKIRFVRKQNGRAFVCPCTRRARIWLSDFFGLNYLMNQQSKAKKTHCCGLRFFYYYYFDLTNSNKNSKNVI